MHNQKVLNGAIELYKCVMLTVIAVAAIAVCVG